mgnify:CR=1 FL=1
MLSWIGKRPLRVIPAMPAQQIETFDPSQDFPKDKNAEIWTEWPSEYSEGGLLFHGDNKEVLAHMLANGFRGKIELIYIDPPFDSGADYVRKVQLRGVRGVAKVDGEQYTIGEQIQYTDIWANDNYLQFMYERFLLLKELLAKHGAIVVHCDWHQGHRLRMLMDEVFGEVNFRNEIIWHYGQRTMARKTRFDMKHDNLLIYAKSDSMELYSSTTPWSYEEFMEHRHDVLKDENGKEYILADGGSGNERYVRYVDDVIKAGKPLDSVWDIPLLNSSDKQRQNFPTQKPESVIERLIRACADSNGIVLDCFIGSGTTAAVAQKLGRRWIGCDINRGAIQTTSKRLQTIIEEQIKERNKHKQKKIECMESGNETELEPSQLGFTVWRVNDYDLQIQHNEAVNLACELVGVERKRGDAYFDGTLGKKLVKIVPFNHPLSPLDLDELKKELKSRPDEDRSIVLVCLGMEISAQSWVDDWNKHLGEGVPNKIEVIELRTDPKYAGFIKHDPATARVSIKRNNKIIQVKIDDFISPTIIKRLDIEESLFKAKITDWRSQVDCVMIDVAYNGSVFNVALSDVPEKKNDLVEGKYELQAPDGETTVAVKIIDMLGEEVLMCENV